MATNLRDISARILSEVIGASPDDVRAMRARGLLEGVGTLNGSGMFYSRAEVIGIACAVALGRAGWGLPAAFAAVGDSNNAIQQALGGRDSDADPTFLTIWPTRSRDGARYAFAAKITVNAREIVQNAIARLDGVLEAEQRKRGRLAPSGVAAEARE